MRVLLALFLLLAPAAFAPSEAAERIESFRAEIAVRGDGVVEVAETIRAVAEGDQIRRGIFRDLSTTFEDAEGRIREVGLDILEVTRNGAPEPWRTERYDDWTRIYVGDADVLIPPGEHTYLIRYRTDRQLRWFEGRPELYWNVTGNTWAFPIQRASARVALPRGVEPVRWTAFTGPVGAQGSDFGGSVGADGVLAVETTRPLAPGDGLTLVVEIPEGAVAPPRRADELRWALRDNRRWLIGGLGFLAVLGYYAAAWRRVGRDPPKGTIIPLFAPPVGVSPALANYIRRWGFSDQWRAFTAAALSLAVKGLILFDDDSGKLSFQATEAGRGADVSGLPPGERAFLGWINQSGGAVAITSANGETVKRGADAFRKAVSAENENKFFRMNLLWSLGGLALSALVLGALFLFGGLREAEIVALVPAAMLFVVIGVVVIPLLKALFGGASLVRLAVIGAVLIAVLAFVGGAVVQMLAALGAGMSEAASFGAAAVRSYPFPFFVALAFPAVNGLFFYLLRAPTPLGRKVMDDLEGFRLYLTTVESPRLNLAGAPEITPERFEAILPYAVALDAERPWAEAFSKALARAHPGEDPALHYRPRWRTGRDWSSAGFARSIASTVAATSTAMASSMPRPKSGSSGFSGGGSGGGGGGRGGGGW